MMHIIGADRIVPDTQPGRCLDGTLELRKSGEKGCLNEPARNCVMSVLIAIPSHERARLLRHCLRTAMEMERSPDCEIVVFDDASPTVDIAGVCSGLPVTVSRSAANLGPSGTICRIWQHFLGGRHRHLLFLDDDLIANTGAVRDAIRSSRDEPGLLSLYNSICHAGQPHGAELLRKRRLGNAGTFWTRELAEICLGALDGTTHVDNRYSEFLQARGVSLLAFKRSRVQHLGTQGRHNSLFGHLEHGLGFEPDSDAQLRAIADTYDDLMSRQGAFRRPGLRVRLATAFGLTPRSSRADRPA